MARDYKLRREVVEELAALVGGLGDLVDLVLVEGRRDRERLEAWGCRAPIATLGPLGVGEAEQAEMLASKCSRLLILTDFDEKGRALNSRFSRLLEGRVCVDHGLRARFGRLMGELRVRAVEDLGGGFERGG